MAQHEVVVREPHRQRARAAWPERHVLHLHAVEGLLDEGADRAAPVAGEQDAAAHRMLIEHEAQAPQRVDPVGEREGTAAIEATFPSTTAAGRVGPASIRSSVRLRRSSSNDLAAELTVKKRKTMAIAAPK